ncbi:MAG TPA: glycosyltransferase family 39 protein [Candidatus Limnocylindrales bacterium]|nr:glycosyltransferase family 39 protein [Candidatus Limnocylindrales bacterium]
MLARFPWSWVALFAAVKLAITLAVANRYGWHRDELYYLASSRHLGFGYVDYPPFLPLLAAADQAIVPGSLVALRFLPALAGACIIVLTALIARELGATTRGQAWAAFAALLSPLLIGGNLMFQTVAFDELVWAIALVVLARLLRTGNQRLWLAMGLVIGIGLETKFTIAALPVAIFLALLISSRRTLLASPWPWLGFAVAILLFVPNLAWQATHDWISVQYTLSHRGHTDGPVAYWLQQLLLFNPLFLLPAVAGTVALRRDPRYAALAYLAVLVEAIFFATGGKAYYPAPIYPLLYAAGAIWLDQRLRSNARVAGFAAGSVALIVILLPIGLPVLPVESMVSLQLWQTRKDYADMIGWPDLAQATAEAYASLPAEQRSGAMILAQNYGEAGAIDYYGPALGLPPAVSPHLTYWYWAPPRMDPSTVVLVGFSVEFGDRYFGSCREVGTITNNLGIHNEEYGAPILVCSNPRRPLWSVWGEIQTLD